MRDLEWFEDRVLHLLFSIADPTRLDTLELQQKLADSDSEHYTSRGAGDGWCAPLPQLRESRDALGNKPAGTLSPM